MNRTLHRIIRVLMVGLIAAGMLALIACEQDTGEAAANASYPVWDLQDGDYRGHFDDREHAVSVQVTIEDETVTNVGLRWQQYDGVRYEENPDLPEDYPISVEAIEGMATQYEDALEYLVGASGVDEIYERTVHMEGNPDGTPVLDAIELQEVDGFTAATIRSSKLASAIRDALNRGRYRE